MIRFLPSAPPSRLLASLEEVTRRFPHDRKLLVCRDRGEGRELLRALTLRTGGWIGWEPATLRDLAHELAFVSLSELGLRALDDVEMAAVADVALDRAVERVGPESRLGLLPDAPGFREAVADAVGELRLAGVGPADVDLPGRGRTRELSLVYELYLEELERRAGADPARVFELALESCDRELRFLRARLFLVPGLRRRGLPGRLLDRLLGSGAETLEGDPVRGLEPPHGLMPPAPPRSSPERPDSSAATDRRGPGGKQGPGQLELLELLAPPARPAAAGDAGTRLAWLHAPASMPATLEPIRVSFFRAVNPSVELREVLRRVLARGLRWDQVEVVTTEPLRYGCALDALTAGMGESGPTVLVTFGVGLPLERSRVGRVLRAYLRWIEEGFHARMISEALLRGDLRAPAVDGVSPGGAGLARRFRELRIGWGRERYAEALRLVAARLLDARMDDLPDRGDDAGGSEDAAAEAERQRRRLELRALELLLRELVASVPAGVPDRGRRSTATTVSPADLARGALRFLQLFKARRGTEEEEALQRVRERLTRIGEVSTRRTTLPAALAEVKARLRLRIPRPGTLGPLPWTSSAGALHLTDVAHGGRSGRPVTFVVGLDAERVIAGSRQDPVLPDDDRRRIARRKGGGSSAEIGLPTSEERLAERTYELASLLASLRGEVTLSYSGWEAGTGSVLAPAPILLQALRVREADPALTFEDLERELGEPVSLVPAGSDAADSTDVWMSALSEGSLLLDGIELVRSFFPALRHGLDAEALRGGNALTAFHGFLPEIRVLDPATRGGRAFSPSEIQRIACCPLAWLYRYGLGLRKPEDPEYQPGQWLTPLERGSVLHRVFERFGRAYHGRDDELREEGADGVLQAIVDDELSRIGVLVPPPSPIARELEAAEIRRSAKLFLEMERGRGSGRWEWFELPFGREEAPPVTVVLPGGGRLPVHGKVDRVDRLEDGRLRIIDYKTGVHPRPGRRPPGPFAGGRKIQEGIYVPALETMLGASVAEFQYRYCTERGEGRVDSYGPKHVAGALAVVESLMQMLERGHFLATDDVDDCRFCDYGRVCRVEHGEHETVSPRAEWSREHRDAPEYAELVRLRSKP